MTASAMWYGVLQTMPTELDYALGHVVLDWQDLVVGILASLVSFPVVYLIILVFKYSRPKVPRANIVITVRM